MDQLSQLTRLGLFDARVPRYTSYPPSTQFRPDITPQQAETWMAAVRPGDSISLYIHVPFCRRLCWFCACHTQGTKSDEPVRGYAETLLAEIALLRKRLAPGVKLSRLHWGGGTPTLLPPDMMRCLAGAVFDAFPLAEGAEFSVEIDPSEIDDARMDALAEAGLTRASIGVQDFDPEIQKTIGRLQSFELTAKVVEMIRARGISSLNADILFGLPHQTSERMAASVQKLLALSPDRVALYGYAHVPWVAKRQRLIPEHALPGSVERLELFEVARQLFEADGYEAIGIDHFARPGDGLAAAQKAGRLRRNFQGYTDDQARVLIGVGASSISHYPQGYAQNAAATPAHVQAIREGRLSVRRGHVFSDEDRWRARMIEALMCDFEVRADEFTSEYGLSADQLQQILDPVARHFGDMVEVGPFGLRIPPRGRPLTRMIARMFDAYDMQASGHSPAM